MTTTTTVTLTDFLLARIAEDEAAVRSVPGPHWIRGVEREGTPGRYRGIAAELVCLPPDGHFFDGEVGPTLVRDEAKRVGLLDHIARYDPTRVLAECEAKRRIVEYRLSEGFADDGMATALHALAAVYADHPDYRDEWRA